MVPPITAVERGVGSRNALALADVWACVKCLADAVALCPLLLYRKQPDGSRSRIDGGRTYELLNPQRAAAPADRHCELHPRLGERAAEWDAAS
jgi:phage portal protein BeeE